MSVHTLVDEVTTVYDLIATRFLIDPSGLSKDEAILLYDWIVWELHNSVNLA